MVDLNPNQQQSAEDEVWGALQGRSIKTLGWTTPIPGAPPRTPGVMVPIGTFHEGTLKEMPTRKQARDFDTGDPKTYQDGNPIMDIVLVLDTAYRDANDPEDDGTRRFICNGVAQRALQDEMRAKNIQRFGIGTYVKITFTGLKPNQGNRQPSKLVAFELRPTEYVPVEQRAVTQQLAAASGPQQQYDPNGQPVTTYAQPPQQPQYGAPQQAYPNSMQQGYQQPMTTAEQHIAGQPPRVDQAYMPAPQPAPQQAPAQPAPQGQGAMPPQAPQYQQPAPQPPQQAPAQQVAQPPQQAPAQQVAQQVPAQQVAASHDPNALAAAVAQLEAANFDRQTAIAAVSAMPQFAGVTRQQVEDSIPI